MDKSNPPATPKPFGSAGGFKEATLLLFPLGGSGSGGGLCGLCFGHALLELVHAAGSVDELLRARVERMAHVANSHQDRRLRRARLDHVPARATNLGVLIFRMDIGFHV